MHRREFLQKAAKETKIGVGFGTLRCLRFLLFTSFSLSAALLQIGWTNQDTKVPPAFSQHAIALSEFSLHYQEFNQRYPNTPVHSEPASSISPKEETGVMPSREPWYKGYVRHKKMIRLFLSGMLFGVMITAAFTYAFAIPANSDYWRWEIWKRGGGAWTFDMKSGRHGWKWMVEPIPDGPPKKTVTVPLSQTKVSTERL